MPAPSWENLDDFLSVDDFADLATFVPSVGAQREPVPVIFDEPYMNVETGEYDMSTGEPRITCKESDVAGIKKNDECIIKRKRPDGTLVTIGTYLLDHDPYPDGTGMACVKLSKDFD